MFFTIDGQKIEIGSYCRKFPSALRSAVRCPALAAGAGPPPVASYFFFLFLSQIFPCIRRVVLGNSLWDSPLFRPVSPGFSPENHTVFRPSSQRTPQNGRKIFPLGFVRPSAVSVRKQCARLVQPYGFTKFPFHHFQQNHPHFFSELRGIFQNSHGVPGRSRQIPSYTLYDLLFFHPWSPAACWFCIGPDSDCSDAPSRFLGFGWSSPRRHGAIRQFFSWRRRPFWGRFYGKKFPFKIQFFKIVFVRRTLFSPLHPVSVVMSHSTCVNRRFFP